MAKFAGLVGYATEAETSPGVWSPVESSRVMKGDFISQSSNFSNDTSANGNVTLNHRVSLLGDQYAFNNYRFIRWIEIDGRKLEVSAIEIRRPRLIISLGGLWNG